MIRIRPLPGPPLDPSGYDLICVSSPNSVASMFERLAAGGRDARSLAGAKLAAIGPGTARALAEHGVTADIVPTRFVAEGLVEALAGVSVTRALIARALHARDVLPQALRELGVEVDVLDLYDTIAEPLSAEALAQARAADYITFTSSSTVRHFLGAIAATTSGDSADSAPERPAVDARIVSIGPATSATLREHGLEPQVEAERHDIAGIIDALLGDAAPGAADGGR